MNADLAFHPAVREVRQAIAELSLISHVSGTSYDAKLAHDTTDDIGGKRPPGSDQEFKPRAPKAPREPHEHADEDEWRIYDQELAGWRIEMEAYDEELESWRACYQRKTPDYFRRELEKCDADERLIALRDECRGVVQAWRRAPLPSGQEPEYGSPQWKRWVGESREDAGDLARRFGLTRRRINQIRHEYRVAA